MKIFPGNIILLNLKESLKNIWYLFKSQAHSSLGCFENPLLFHFLFISSQWLNYLGSLVLYLSRTPLPSSKRSFEAYVLSKYHISFITSFASLKILKMKDMIHQDTLKFVFKSPNHLSPPHFHNLFQFNNAIHFYGRHQALEGISINTQEIHFI